MKKEQREKYKNAVLYFSTYLNNYQLGNVKLAKLLYYFDFISYRDKNKSVTNTVYYKQEFGPLDKNFFEIIGELIKEKRLEVERFLIPENKRETYNYRPLKKADESVFNDYELILLRKLVNKYKQWKTEEIVAKSHLEMPWSKAKYGESLDYKWSFDVEDFDLEIEKEYKQEDQEIEEALLKQSC